MAVQILILLVGLALIVFGADWLVDGASTIARKAGISEFVIGLTIVGFGTSCPELVVSLTGAFAGNSDISIGNVVGSNIFNILLIIGVCATVTPLHVNSLTQVDLGLFMLSALMLLSAAFCFKKKVLDRGDAVLYLVAYAGYVAWLFISM